MSNPAVLQDVVQGIGMATGNPAVLRECVYVCVCVVCGLKILFRGKTCSVSHSTCYIPSELLGNQQLLASLSDPDNIQQ